MRNRILTKKKKGRKFDKAKEKKDTKGEKKCVLKLLHYGLAGYRFVLSQLKG